MAFDDILEAEDSELVFDGEDFVNRKDYEEYCKHESMPLQNPTLEEMTRTTGIIEEVLQDIGELPNLKHLDYLDSNRYLIDIVQPETK
ncbi:MAG: hypothetical protein QXD13_00310 [Candidatus Pacearchaeota archaeon]